jgi:tetratricopeptide (TPR) repeat protein
MKNQLDYSEFIERYLDGEMTGQELIWFEKELDSDEWLQKEVRLRQKVNQAILDEDSMRFGDELENAYAAFMDNSGSHSHRKRKIIIGGSVLATAIVAFILILGLTSREYTNEQLFERYYKPYESNMTFRSADNELNPDLVLAMQLYENENYNEALKLFERILQNDPKRVGLNFYSGISQMEIKEYDQAGRSFNKVIDDRYNMYMEQAEWYLSLCYIITNQDDKAVRLLEKISSDNGFFHKEAVKLLRKLN